MHAKKFICGTGRNVRIIIIRGSRRWNEWKKIDIKDKAALQTIIVQTLNH